jgi:uncharacterized SAM-binding protein YcdF (DUF218 family)
MLAPLSFSFLMPPMIFIATALFGLLISWRWRRIGMTLIALSILALYVCSTPLASSWLLERAAAQPVTAAAAPASAQAIVLLMADARWGNAPGDPDLPGPLSLERIAETARLYRTLGLPVLVSGGVDRRTGKILAALGSAVLSEDFKVPIRWREERSANTYENAALSAPMLTRDGISRALVVTQDWDMARAIWAFERVGIEAFPAPAGEHSARPDRVELEDFLPSYRGFQDSFYGLHELMGLPYYRWRYGTAEGR